MEFKENQAIYLQIVNLVYDHIVTGKWPEGERIPSVRELGVQLQVNPNTVMRAYECLQAREIILNRRGVGFFVAPEASGRIAEEKRKAFLHNVLPGIFHEMELLGISWETIQEEYEKFRKENLS